MVPADGIIPAYAGSTMVLDVGSNTFRDHPRIRGEHETMQDASAMFTGSSPHTRGARNLRQQLPARIGIIPAYAGSTGLASE